MALRGSKTRRRGKSSLAGVVLFLLILAIAALVIISRVCVVKTIDVRGASSIPIPDIIAVSGLKEGESIFRVNAERVRQRFETVGRLSFDGLTTSFPSTVVLNVHERLPRVLINYAGLPTVLDENGYAIEQSREMPNLQLLVVTGLRTKSCQVGRRIQSDVPQQVDFMCTVVQALLTQQMTGMASELNISDLDNMYLMLNNGMMVKLGDHSQMQNKLLLMAGALADLNNRGTTNVIINVSGGGSAVIQPLGDQILVPPSDPQNPVINENVGA